VEISTRITLVGQLERCIVALWARRLQQELHTVYKFILVGKQGSILVVLWVHGHKAA